MNRTFLIGGLVLILLFALSVNAEIDTGNEYHCATDADCSAWQQQAGLSTYCSRVTQTCTIRQQCHSDVDCSFCDQFDSPGYDYNCICDVDNTCSVQQDQPVAQAQAAAQVEGPSPEELAAQQQAVQAQQQFDQLQQQLAALGQTSSDVAARLATLERMVASLQQGQEATNPQLVALREDITNLQSDISTTKSGFEKKVTSVSTGLAGLQTNLGTTNKDLDTVEEKVTQQESFTHNATIVFFLLAIIAVGVGVYYYMTRNQKKSSESSGVEVNSQIVEYITTNVRQGRKYPQIKQSLLAAGWPEDQIEAAYKDTMKQNYDHYLQASGQASVRSSSSSSSSSASSAKKQKAPAKAAYMGVFVLLIIAGIFFLFNGSNSGHAIFFNVSQNDSNEDGYNLKFFCLPPHIPSKVGCCLDVNGNGLCDFSEGRELNRPDQDAGECTDTTQCQRGKMCIEGACMALESIYPQNECAQKCDFTQVHIKTNDGHEYDVVAGGGDYTAAGGIEWEVLDGPQYCHDDIPVIPIKITKKKGREILEESVVTLEEQETSKAILLPNSPNVHFMITAKKIQQECGR